MAATVGVIEAGAVKETGAVWAAGSVREIAPAYGRAERDGSPEPSGSRGSAEPHGSPRAAPPDADGLDELADEIARLAAHLHAGRARLLGLVARFDELEGWKAGGHRSCAHWLSFRTGMDLRTARDHVRVARALARLPRMRRAMQKGRLSFSQVRAVTRVATPETEAELLELAEGCPTATLERRVRAWKRAGRKDEAARERGLHRARRLAVYPDEDGMVEIRGRVPPEVGAVLMRALEAAEDALYRRERSEGEQQEDGSAEPSGSRRSAEPRSPRQRRAEASRRRADAVGLLAERALAAGFGATGSTADGEDADDGEDDGSGEPDAPISGTRAERYLVFLHVDPATLTEHGEPGRSELSDGTRVAADTARRLACDAGAVQVNRDADGAVLDLGRKRRTVPPALRRALEVRDRGCRFPGCGLRFTDAHHLVHWADGGETSLENTVLLCRHHHRLVHEEGWRVEWWGTDRAVFLDPRGRVHMDTGWTSTLPSEPGPDPVEALERENRRRGADPGPMATTARWKRERDVPDEVWFRALEAGLTGAERRRTATGEP